MGEYDYATYRIENFYKMVLEATYNIWGNPENDRSEM